MVTTERKIYYNKTSLSVSCLEGEEWDGFVETKTDKPLPQNELLSPSVPTETPKSDAPNPENNPKLIQTPHKSDNIQSEAEICLK